MSSRKNHIQFVSKIQTAKEVKRTTHIVRGLINERDFSSAVCYMLRQTKPENRAYLTLTVPTLTS